MSVKTVNVRENCKCQGTLNICRILQIKNWLMGAIAFGISKTDLLGTFFPSLYNMFVPFRNVNSGQMG